MYIWYTYIRIYVDTLINSLNVHPLLSRTFRPYYRVHPLLSRTGVPIIAYRVGKTRKTQ